MGVTMFIANLKVQWFSLIVQWLTNNIFTIKPITSITIPNLIILYLLYTFIGFLVIAPIYTLYYFWRRPKPNEEKEIPTVKIILAAVLFENVVFRGIPLILFGPSALLPCHIIWAIMHWDKAQTIWVCYHGLIDLRLWLGGLWYYGFAVHLAHDLIRLAIDKYTLRKRRTKNNQVFSIG